MRLLSLRNVPVPALPCTSAGSPSLRNRGACRLHMRRAVGQALIVTALITSMQPAQAQTDGARRSSEVDRLFAKWDSNTTPGCALAVVRDGAILYKRGYGMANLDHDIPIRPSTIFHVASISKQFTATAVSLLEQHGTLSLDDDVRKYVPELPDFGMPVRLRHLLHHTSGLRDQWTLLGLAGWRVSRDLITDQDVLDVLSQQKELNFSPGEQYVYSNSGYTLLAQVVKRLSGKTFRAFTEQSIFKPLGMNHTHFRDDHSEIVKNVAYGYEPAGDSYRLSLTNFDTVGATSLLTTVEDFALWDHNFYTGRVGGQTWIQRTRERGRLNDGEQIRYGFGLIHDNYRGLPIVSHNGVDAGYRSDYLRFPEQRFSVICFCNASDAQPTQLTRRVADIYLADELQPNRPKLRELQATLPNTELSRYTGTYWQPATDSVQEVLVKYGKLQVRFQGRIYVLDAVGDNTFQLQAASPLEFHFKSAGDVRYLMIRRQGFTDQQFEALRDVAPLGDLPDYSGSYRSDEVQTTLSVVVRENGLELKRPKFPAAELRPTGVSDLFQAPIGNVRFIRDVRGRITGCVLQADRVRNLRFAKQN
jgi:CubicO group peptidase (beta-lactamase class C family)